MPIVNICDVLADLKNELGYTAASEDAGTDDRLGRYIKQGTARLEEIAGCSLDFTLDAVAYGLLIDYCRYANSQLAELFEINYREQLSALNACYCVKKYLQKEDEKNADEKDRLSDV